ncbi:MAG: ankyrin repeat domain-containing protein [Verrucomicrobiales bacterium]|nr:ankyrin repeat domain-containing protein [Verrucomicrobiales bacterium]
MGRPATEAARRRARALLAGAAPELLALVERHDGVRLFVPTSGGDALFELFPTKIWEAETRAVRRLLASLSPENAPPDLGELVAVAGAPGSADRVVIVLDGPRRGEVLFLDHEAPRRPKKWPGMAAFLAALVRDPIAFLEKRLGIVPELDVPWRRPVPSRMSPQGGPTIRLVPRGQDVVLALPEGWVAQESHAGVAMLLRAEPSFGPRLFVDTSLPDIPWGRPEEELDRWLAGVQEWLPHRTDDRPAPGVNVGGKPAKTRRVRGSIRTEPDERPVAFEGLAVAAAHGDGGCLALLVAPRPTEWADPTSDPRRLLERAEWRPARPRPWNEALGSLAAAVSAGHSAAVRRLLALGADPNSCDDRDISALFRAVQNGSEELTRLLLRAGADPNAGAERVGWISPLVPARRGKRRDLADLLLRAGARA